MRTSRSRNSPSTGPRTGKPRPDLLASTLAISNGTTTWPHGFVAAPSGVYHGLGSVIVAAFSASENG